MKCIVRTGQLFLDIGDIAVQLALVNIVHRYRHTVGIVAEVQHVAAYGHLAQLAAVVDVIVAVITLGAPQAHAVHIIGAAPCGSTVKYGGHLSADSLFRWGCGDGHAVPGLANYSTIL